MRRTAVLTAVSVMVLSAGCSGDQEPDADVTPIIPTETASSAVATPTQEPEAESAEEFVRRWQSVSDDMVVSGNLARYRDMYVDCSPCERFAKQVEELYDGGGRFEAGGNEVTRVVTMSDTPMILRATMVAEPSRLIQGSGESREFPGGRQTIEFHLGGEPGAWTMRSYSLLPQ